MAIVPPIIQPENPIARFCVLAFSGFVFVAFAIAMGFVCREIQLDVWVPDYVNGELISSQEVIQMWINGTRFDCQMATYFALPILGYAAVTFMLGNLWKWVYRGLVVLVFALYLVLAGAMIVNFHYLNTTNELLTMPVINTFLENPTAYFGFFWDNYSVLFSSIFAIFTAVVFTGLWARFAFMMSRWDVWHNFTIWHAIGTPVLLGYLFLMLSQSPYGLGTPLTVRDATVSDTCKELNQTVVNAPWTLKIFG